MQVFLNSEFGALGVLEIDGKPYFPATASAKMLGYASPRDAISRHCKIIPDPRPKVLELQIPNEEPLLKAVGGLDLDVMNKNAMKRNGGFDNE